MKTQTSTWTFRNNSAADEVQRGWNLRGIETSEIVIDANGYYTFDSFHPFA